MTNGNSPWLALKLAIDVGYDLTSEHPEIADYYREGMSHRQIAGVIKRNGGFGRKISSESILEHAVKFSLTGNYQEEAGKVYSGLMDREEYDNISAGNRTKARKLGPIECQKQNKGIFNLTEEEVERGLTKSCMSRGQVPWEEHEKKDALRLKKQGFTSRYIADILNRAYHEGREIRNKDAVNGMFTRKKISKK